MKDLRENTISPPYSFLPETLTSIAAPFPTENLDLRMVLFRWDYISYNFFGSSIVEVFGSSNAEVDDSYLSNSN